MLNLNLKTILFYLVILARYSTIEIFHPPLLSYHGKMAEGNKNQIPIEDVTPDAFRFLKNLFYVTTVGDSVQLRSCATYNWSILRCNVNKWRKAVVKVRVVIHYEDDREVSKIFCFHPWNFGCLRPLWCHLQVSWRHRSRIHLI